MLMTLAAGQALPAPRRRAPAAVRPCGHPPPALRRVSIEGLSRAELVAVIQEHEGQSVDDPPFLFKLVVALGFCMLGFGLAGLALCITSAAF